MPHAPCQHFLSILFQQRYITACSKTCQNSTSQNHEKSLISDRVSNTVRFSLRLRRRSRRGVFWRVSQQLLSTVCFSLWLRRWPQSGVSSRVFEQILSTVCFLLRLRRGSRRGVFSRIYERLLSTVCFLLRLRRRSQSGVVSHVSKLLLSTVCFSLRLRLHLITHLTVQELLTPQRFGSGNPDLRLFCLHPNLSKAIISKRL